MRLGDIRVGDVVVVKRSHRGRLIGRVYMVDPLYGGAGGVGVMTPTGTGVMFPVEDIKVRWR